MLAKLLSVSYESAPLKLDCIHIDKTRGDQVYNVYLGSQKIGRIEIGWDQQALKLHLISIYPYFRDKGIGAALLEYLLELAAANGKNSLIISTKNSALLHIALKLRPDCFCTVRTFWGERPIHLRETLIDSRRGYTVCLPVVSDAGIAGWP
jgi:GNAT superfamily N-acetyltransferase